MALRAVIIAALIFAATGAAAQTAGPAPVPAQKSYKTSVVNGFNVVVPDGITIAIFSGAALMATGTITLPVNPTDGQPLSLESPKGVTLLSLLPNTGQSLSNGFSIASMGVNSPVRLKYSAVDGSWYPN